jgi:hypothetical protein
MQEWQLKLEALEGRVGVLEDERDVLDAMYRYCHTIDYGLKEEWVDCFTPDGAFELRSPGGERTKRHAGADNLLTFVRGHTSAPGRWHKHLVADPRISVDGDAATAVSYYIRMDRSGDSRNYIRSFGRYRDRLSRSADGRWRFVERIAEGEAFDPGDLPPNL